jgi:DNA-binding CsgD family transcriptional regulator
MGIVERTEELLTLGELFGSYRSDTSRVVLIEGAAATGKTSLLHEFAGRAVDAGATFISASASRAERDLPLSAVSQLFRGPALSAAETDRAERLLGDGVLTATAHGAGHDSEAVVQVPAPILSRLSAILLALAERGCLVIGVDDIHHADVASLQFLLYLARRTRSAPVFLVLTECLRPSRPYSLLHSDLLRRPSSHRLRLRPLSEQGVAAMLAEHFDAETAQSLAPECHRASGGNPLLVEALIEDHRMSGPAQPARLAFGDAFRQAVITCLYRSDSTALARGIAVLPESASTELLGEIVQLDADSIGLTRDVLRAAGLSDAGSLRHEAVRAAVLSGMRPDERTALHLRAAELLHSHGAGAEVVAGHLLAADQASAPWGVPVLRDAAQQALAEGRAPDAISHLRLALRECADDDARPAVHLDLARAEWQVDPATAARHLPELVTGLRKGLLCAGGAATVIAGSLWLGRTDLAIETMIETSGAGIGPVGGAPRWWLRYAYPGFAQQETLDGVLPPLGDAPEGPVAPSAALSPGAAGLLESVLERGAHEETVERAAQILAEAGPAFRTLAPVLAIAALIYADELDGAEWWCDTFGRSAFSQTPLIRALVAGLRALVHTRRGELDAAMARVREAFELTSPKGWGVVVGIPLATMLSALTAAGEYEEAEKYLDTPLPEALFQSPLVLPYLQARGRYYLAINRPQAALAEFQACGELMSSWGFDAPGFVPWRDDMAEALLVLGDRDEAGRLAAEQLARLPRGRLRARGRTLRVLAAASGAEHGMELLKEAVELLEKVGDRLELARALADLSEFCRAAGQARRAEALGRRARLLAAECGAEDVGSVLSSRLAGVDAGSDGLDPDPLTGLSEAERRVAALAADGYTNSQIAGRLYVTKSTVEQHLTRVYRKLKIRRRTDLPLTLSLLPARPGFPDSRLSRTP